MTDGLGLVMCVSEWVSAAPLLAMRAKYPRTSASSGEHVNINLLLCFFPHVLVLVVVVVRPTTHTTHLLTLLILLTYLHTLPYSPYPILSYPILSTLLFSYSIFSTFIFTSPLILIFTSISYLTYLSHLYYLSYPYYISYTLPHLLLSFINTHYLPFLSSHFFYSQYTLLLLFTTIYIYLLILYFF